MDSDTPNTVTSEHREKFRECLTRAQCLLGLLDWRVTLSDEPATAGNMAEVETNYFSRMAHVYLGSSFGGQPVTDRLLLATAVHEMLHVLLDEIKNQVEYKIKGESLGSAEHRVVNVLEFVLLEFLESSKQPDLS